MIKLRGHGELIIGQTGLNDTWGSHDAAVTQMKCIVLYFGGREVLESKKVVDMMMTSPLLLLLSCSLLVHPCTRMAAGSTCVQGGRGGEEGGG